MININFRIKGSVFGINLTSCAISSKLNR